jgi:hypothetical protein
MPVSVMSRRLNSKFRMRSRSSIEQGIGVRRGARIPHVGGLS